ncbi:unnamed protein product [Cunninghamella blakesleeana]
MPTVPIICRVRALYSFSSNDKSSLEFEQGDVVEVLNKLKSGWWDGWCNGQRGWFPSNYVETIEEYTDASVMELSSNDELTRQDNSFTEISRPYALQSTQPLPRAPKNGVPLQQNKDHRLSLPYNHNYEIENIQQSSSPIISRNQPPTPNPSLPPNWIVEMTEDGTGCYYYNKLTGEMRTNPPINNTSNSPTNNNNNNNMNNNNSIMESYSYEDMESTIDNDVDDDEFDFQSVDSRLQGLSSRLQLNIDEDDVILEEDENEDFNNNNDNNNDSNDNHHLDTLPPNWVERINHQGRVYYCNLQTQETTWDKELIDLATGHLLPQKNNQEKAKNTYQPKNDNVKQSIDSTVKSSITKKKIDLNEPLTWNILSTHIAFAINELNMAAKQNQSDQFEELASQVINTIRQMLLSSETIDKDSPHIKSNSLLRDHHRVMMASMSKVFLTAILSADTGGDNITKLLNETNDLLVGVRNFVGTCQSSNLMVKHVDPRILDTTSDEYKSIQQQKKSSLSSTSSSASSSTQMKYALQHDLSDNLDLFGSNMHESVDAILSDVNNGKLNQSNSSSSSTVITDTMRLQFGAKLFTQFRNLSSQTGQFLGLVDDIDFTSVKDSPLLNELQYEKQSLSDGLGRLFCHLQQLTGTHMPFLQVLDHVENAAKEIHIPISNICECISVMVYEYEMAKKKSSIDTIKKKSSISTTSSPALRVTSSILEEDEEENHPSHFDDNDINSNTNINHHHEDDDISTIHNDSIFSGGNLTLQTELTDYSNSSLRKQSQSKLTVSSSIIDDRNNNINNNNSMNDISSDSQANAVNIKKNTKLSKTTAVVEHKGGVRDSNLSDSTTINAQQDVETNKSTHKLKKFFGDDVPSTDISGNITQVAERPSYLEYDYDLSDIIFNMEGNVKGGTISALVERLTLHDYLDMNFNNTFLLTYRSFCTSTELLDLLEERYNLNPPSNLSNEEMEIWSTKKLKLVRLRVFNVLKNWLEVYYNEEDYVILERLMKFTDTTIRSTLSFSTDQLERLIQKRKESDDSDPGLKKLVWTPQSIPDPILPRKNFKLLDLDPTELARQLTLIDFKMYSSIRPIECLDKAWSRETTDDSAPPVAVNIRASIEYCNQVTSWVSDAILSQNDVKKRSNLIKFWVQVAEKCRELNNFNTCMAVLSAFDNSSVGRLKRTWEMVGARTNQILSNIRKIMGANRNFSEYRQLIHSVNPPCIPFLGIYLQDLTFIEDGNSNVISKSKDLINFAKREKTAEVIREIQQYQTLFYKLKPVDDIQEFIRNHLQSTRDEDQLYKESLKLEPREREDEKITRLLQESGFL